MNRILTTAGLAVLGAASVVPASAQELITDQKPWAIGATLRGFYDDNYLTYPRALRDQPGFDDNTFGFDVSPQASYNLRRDQTTFGVSYQYGFRYFFDREDHRYDQSHQANLKLSHAFNERYSVDLKDSFVVAQEPSVIDPSISITVPARSEGNNIRNTAGIQFNANLLEHFGIVLGYNNSIYDYEQDAADVAAVQAANPLIFPVVTGEGSRSAVLDRIEHEFSIDGNYQILPKTTLSLGYIYSIVDFTSDDPYVVDPVLGTIPGTAHDWKSHKVTLGARQQINPQFVVSGKVGVEITTYDSDKIWDDKVGPYAEASGSWNYSEGSALQVGVRHRRIPTDVRVIPGAGGVNADTEATSVFISVTQRIATKFMVNAMAQYQYGRFEGTSGSSDIADNVFYGGVTFAYQITRNVAAEAGYTYDRLDSDLAFRSFTRNRVFVGTRLTF